jgi:hypothetical protein
MSINEAIIEIVNTIQKKHYFDSHLIIQLLIEKHSDEYISYVSQYITSGEITTIAHSQLGREIQKLCQAGLIVQIDEKSLSYNIHHNLAECTLYQKL